MPMGEHSQKQDRTAGMAHHAEAARVPLAVCRPVCRGRETGADEQPMAPGHGGGPEAAVGSPRAGGPRG